MTSKKTPEKSMNKQEETLVHYTIATSRPGTSSLEIGFSLKFGTINIGTAIDAKGQNEIHPNVYIWPISLTTLIMLIQHDENTG